MTIHIIGAGLSGLACAVRLIEAGQQVIIYEMAHYAGGRCRSFYDSKLERYLDNGTHLILSANTQTLKYIDHLNCTRSFTVVTPAVFPFLDLKSGEQWTLQPNGGPLPWWLIFSKRRVAGSHLIDYLSVYHLWKVREGGSGLSVADCLAGPLMPRLWKPLTEAILNTEPEIASAALFARVIRNSLMRGERACRPYIAHHGLGSALIEPAIRHIMAACGVLRFRSRLRAVSSCEENLHLPFETETIETKKGDNVVLALPPWSLSMLWPGLPLPTAFRGIVNVHYRLEKPVQLPGGRCFLGVVGGLAQWLFVRGDVLSVTVSAANHNLVTQESTVLAQRVWSDCATILKLSRTKRPPARVIKERRATLAQTFAEDNKTVPFPPLAGLVFAGDWTDPSLPNTIESAISSGVRAASQVLDHFQ